MITQQTIYRDAEGKEHDRDQLVEISSVSRVWEDLDEPYYSVYVLKSELPKEIVDMLDAEKQKAIAKSKD